MKLRTLVSALAAIAMTSAIAYAANTTFFTSIGDLVFPFTPPTKSAPGLIDNMAITGSPNLMCVSTTPATATDAAIFVATRPVKLTSVSEVHAVAAGGASVIQIVKDTGTAAPGAGTDLLTNNSNTGFNLNSTANTVQVGTLNATAANLLLATGDRLSYDFANAIQSSAGIAITACFSPQ
jgi:hypothetical protein